MCPKKFSWPTLFKGSGKTLAFIIPILEILSKLSTPLKKHEIGTLIISPTRELASQISEVLAEFLKDIDGDLTQQLFIGGNKVDKDVQNFEDEGANIVIGTPGRLEDLLMGKTVGAIQAGINMGLLFIQGIHRKDEFFS